MINKKYIKVGTLIKIRNDLENNKIYGDIRFNDKMKHGIQKVSKISPHCFFIENCDRYIYSFEMIDFIVPEFIKYISNRFPDKMQNGKIYKVITEEVLESPDFYKVECNNKNHDLNFYIPERFKTVDIWEEIEKEREIMNETLAQRSKDKVKIKCVDGIPFGFYCYLRNGIEVILVFDALHRCSTFLNVITGETYDIYNNDFSSTINRDYDIIRVEDRGRNVIYKEDDADIT